MTIKKELKGSQEMRVCDLSDCYENYHEEIIKPHVHSFFLMIWFKEGGGVHSVDFKDYEIHPNSIFFISPGQVHNFDPDVKNKGCLLTICNNFLQPGEQKEDIFMKYNIFNAGDHVPYCVLEDDIVPKVESLVEEIRMEEKEKERFAHTEMLRSLTRQLFINIHRHSTKKDEIVLLEKKPSHRLFIKFRKMLDENYRSMHLVADYASALNVSTKTLSNSIIECTGIAPLTFINDRVLLEAKRLLLYSNMMTKEVAFALGFDDPSYFSKFFKRHTNYLPSEYKYHKV